jgi:hypothetical protein
MERIKAQAIVINEGADKENYEQGEKSFSEALDRSEHLRHIYGIERSVALSELAESLEAEKMEKYKHSLIKLAEAGLAKDKNIYIAFECLEKLGDTEKIISRIKKGIRYASGSISYDLFKATCKYGNEEQIKKATKEFTESYGVDSLSAMPYYKEKFDEIGVAISRYRYLYGIANNVGVNAEMINASMELLKKDYDLAVGVIRSGSPIATMLEIGGLETRYIEWHRGWKKGPVWKKIGKETWKVEGQKKNIIVCEHDTQTGNTLDIIQPLIEALEPDKVDVCFWIDMHRTNKKVVEQRNFYNDSYNANDFPVDDFFNNLQNILKIIRSENFQELVN